MQVFFFLLLLVHQICKCASFYYHGLLVAAVCCFSQDMNVIGRIISDFVLAVLTFDDGFGGIV